MKPVLINTLAVLAMCVGASMLFAQRPLRRWWQDNVGGIERRSDSKDKISDDPLSYALRIFGMMLFAFGLMILVFVTAFYCCK